MKEKYRILLLDDSNTDAEIIQRFLLKQKLPYEFRLATDEKSFTEALDDFAPRVILSDNSMPQFSASEALKITRRRKQYIPFIMVTGTVSEEFAASIIRQGADDYILKDRMNRLPAAIEAALKQRQAEKEITDYKYALENGYIVTITDQLGKIQYANDNFCKISGYKLEELIGMNHRAVNAGYHSSAFISNLWATVAKGQIWKGEYCSKSKKGSLYWVDATIIPFLDEKANPYQYVVMCTNITERKRIEVELQKSNERFKYATMASSDIIWEMNFESRENMVYEGKENFTGIENNLKWQMRTDWEYVMEADRERVSNSFLAARTNPATNFWKEEYGILSAENTTWHIVNQTIFIRDENGKAIRAIGAITDITEKKKLEAELFEQYANEQLKITATALAAQERERNAIGQELHDNVNQILLGTKLLLSVIKDDTKENLAFINTCMQNLQSAIDENRKIAHTLVIPDFHTISLTDQLLNLTDTMLKTPGIDVHIDTAGLNEVLLDEEYKLSIYRIAQEQCTNIVKYAEAQVVNITLSSSNTLFSMSISDDGKGMDNSKKTNGIGLKNIKGRLGILKGKASIDTEPGRGFTLTIFIPLKPAVSF